MTFGLPNHPSYPSGHSCVSAAAATVLGYLFPERTTELDTWVTEAGLSRMYAGIHYRFDIVAGRDLGPVVASSAWRVAALSDHERLRGLTPPRLRHEHLEIRAPDRTALPV